MAEIRLLYAQHFLGTTETLPHLRSSIRASIYTRAFLLPYVFTNDVSIHT